MTWKELVKKAKELGYALGEDRDSLEKCVSEEEKIIFYKCGEIYVTYNDGCWYVTLAINRKVEQMYQIMIALEN